MLLAEYSSSARMLSLPSSLGRYSKVPQSHMNAVLYLTEKLSAKCINEKIEPKLKIIDT
jgi:hypothetical protein